MLSMSSSVHGVAEVASVGGLVSEYRIEVDPNKLKKNEEIRLQDLSAKVWAGKKDDEITA